MFTIFIYGSLLFGGLGMSILVCPKKTKKKLYNTTWEIAKGYVKLEDFCLNIIKPNLCQSLQFLKKGEAKEYQITFHNSETNKYEMYIDQIPYIKSNWMFVKRKIGKNTRCKIFENIELLTTSKEYFEEIKNPFFEVELEQNNERIDLKESLEYFMINKNKILDTLFLRWVLKYWFGEKLANKYKIHIIDSDVNIFVLQSNQYIILNKNKYDIKDNIK